jgi:ubiquinone/menaquinone biosynthesis C-methylase UbiE
MSNIGTLSWDPVWEKIFQENEWGKYPPEHVVRFVARNFYNKKPDRKLLRLLDLGCGPGACTWYMAREGFAVSGIDGSPTAISNARKRLLHEGLSADLQVGDFTSLPWPDGYFDGVVDNATLCCNRFTQCQRVVAEVHRVLKLGGKFLSANFTDKTCGYGEGENIEESTFRNIQKGPLAGKGLTLFMNRGQVDRLYGSFKLVSVEKASWTTMGMSEIIEQWLVESEK